MRLSSLSALALCGLLAASCAGNKNAKDSEASVFVPVDYTLTVTNLENLDSAYAYLYDYDALTSSRNPNSDALIDSALVMGNQVVFNVKGSSAPVAVLYYGSERRLIFPEAGENTFNVADNTASGSMGQKYKAYTDSINSVYASIDVEKAPERGTPEYQQFVDSISNLSDKITNDAMTDNIDNAFGYFIVTNVISSNSEIVDSLVNVAPYLADSKRVKTAREDNEKLKATSVGQPYTDFTIESNGKSVKLSDYIKPDRYTLVDFWASWCGPCKRAIKGLKENYADLNAKGLDIVGVAVWEDPAETEKWLKDNPLPWQIILDAQKVPTDIYAVKGIPTLILIGPDGKILARSHSDEEVLEAFNAAIAAPAE